MLSFIEGLLTVFSCSKRGKGAVWGPFYKGTNPTREGGAVTT